MKFMNNHSIKYILLIFLFNTFDCKADNFPKDLKISKEYEEKGIIFIKQKQYEKAIEYFNKSIELNPNRRSNYFRKGCALIHLKKYEEAVSLFDTVLKMDADQNKKINLDIPTLINKSSVLLKLRRYKEVIECCNLGLNLTQKEPLLYDNKGDALLNLNRYTEAIDNYNKAI